MGDCRPAALYRRLGLRRDRRRVGGKFDYRRAACVSRLSDRGIDRAGLIRGGLPAALERRAAAGRRDRGAAPGDRAHRGAGEGHRSAACGGRRRYAVAQTGGRDAGAGVARAPSRHASHGRTGHADHERVAAGTGARPREYCQRRRRDGGAPRERRPARARGRVGDRHARSHPGRVRRARAQRLDLCGARGRLHRCRPLRRRCWPRSVRCRVRFTAAHAIVSSRCSRNSMPGCAWRSA